MADAIASEAGFSLQAEDGSFLYADVPALPIGDTNDMARRLAAVLPRRWFGDDAPIIGALLQGLGSGFADIWGLLAFTRLQTRLTTATEAFLDLASTDFLPNFLRRANEPDAAFSLRLRREIVRPRNTRAAIIKALKDLTGNTPTVVRPSNPADCGGVGHRLSWVGYGWRLGRHQSAVSGFCDHTSRYGIGRGCHRNAGLSCRRLGCPWGVGYWIVGMD